MVFYIKDCIMAMLLTIGLGEKKWFFEDLNFYGLPYTIYSLTPGYQYKDHFSNITIVFYENGIIEDSAYPFYSGMIGSKVIISI